MEKGWGMNFFYMVTVGGLGILAGSIFIFMHANEEERNVLLALRHANTCVQKSIHLSELVARRYRDFCFQPPYVLKDGFEGQSKHEAPGFVIADDRKAYWWFYTGDGKSLKVEIPRIEVLERTKPPPQRCYLVKSTQITFSCESGRPKYYFEEIK